MRAQPVPPAFAPERRLATKALKRALERVRLRRRSQDTAAPRSPLHRLCSAPGGAAVRCGVTASCSSIPLLPRFDPQMSSMALLLEAEQMYPPVR